MTLIQYANMRWQEMKTDGITMRECKECYPLESFVQEWVNFLRDQARDKKIDLKGISDLKKRGYNRVWFSIVHDFPYLQEQL